MIPAWPSYLLDLIIASIGHLNFASLTVNDFDLDPARSTSSFLSFAICIEVGQAHRLCWLPGSMPQIINGHWKTRIVTKDKEGAYGGVNTFEFTVYAGSSSKDKFFLHEA